MDINRKYTSRNEDYYLCRSITPASAPKQFFNHIHNFYEIILILKGSGSYGTDTYSLPVFANDLIITPAHTYHYLDMKQDEAYERYVIYSSRRELTALLDERLRGVRGVLSISDNRELKHYFSKLDYGFELREKLTPKLFDTLMRHNIEELIIYLCAMSPEDFKSRGGESDYPPIFTEIIAYISANLREATVKRIADRFRISPTYLYTLFKKHLFISPSDYLISQRLTFAASLIEAGENRTNAAFACGYQNYSSFYRAYLKHYGTPPTGSNKQKDSI